MSNLNIQGLARREKALMSCLEAVPGHSFVSIDLSAGEPTITTHFSQDPYYMAATFGMIGKEPYYDEQDVLMIDDIYIMCMSVSPMGRNKVKEVFNTLHQNGRTFVEQWMQDKDHIQKVVFKKERPFHKILCLGLGYSMGPKHMVESAFKAGYTLSLKDAKAFFKAYWALFKEVKSLGSKLEKQFLRQGYLINPFGYRLVPDKSYKSLNYFIQSSVSGVMHVLCAKFFVIAPYCQFITIIHDELILQVADKRLEEARLAMLQAVDSLNEDLNWTVKVRTGWQPGKTLYEAK